MSQALDPLTQRHVRQAADQLKTEFAGIFSVETIERYIGDSLDLLGESRINVFVPVLAHRFARERLKALAQAEHLIATDQPEVLFVCVHNAGPQPDGGRAGQASLGGADPRPLRRERTGERDQPGRDRGDGRARGGHERGVPEAAHRRVRASRRRRDHDGLRRRLPDLPRQEVRGLGARRPRRAGPRRRCARSATRSTCVSQQLIAELLPAELSALVPARAGRRGDRHVRARLRRLRRDHGRRQDATTRPRRSRDHLRARDHGDDLRGRAHLAARTSTRLSRSRSRSAATSPGRARSSTGQLKSSERSPRRRSCAARSATSPMSAQPCRAARRVSHFSGSSS